jgi:hypothetical protein
MTNYAPQRCNSFRGRVGVTAHADELVQRWAILAEPEIQKTALSDLLTVELSKSLELVEREQLQQILAEVELSKLVAADGVRLRLKVGPEFKAERLIVLTLEKSTTRARYLRVVVCETRQGTRLQIYRRAWPPNEPQALARDLAQAISATRQRFPKGVQQIIGVGPFLSRNLLHDYDYLQRSYAALLMESLLEIPGIAVLELDEYRALSEELSLNATRLEERGVPVLVEGEFELTGQGVSFPQSEVRLDLTVTTSGPEPRSWRQSNQSLMSGANWVRLELPQLLLNSVSHQQTPLSTDDQFAALIKRADAFGSIGLRSESIALRESALLLKNDLVQHLRLLGSYHLHVTEIENNDRLAQSRWFAGKKFSHDEIRERSRKLDARNIPILKRYTQLVTQRLAARDVNMAEGGILWSSAMNKLTGGYSREGTAVKHDLRREFFWGNIPYLNSLDATIRRGDAHPEVMNAHGRSFALWKRTPGGQSLLWTTPALIRADDLEARNVYLRRPFSSQRMFDDIERLLREAAPWPVASFVRHAFPPMALRGHSGDYDQLCRISPVTTEEFTGFYQRLAESDDLLMQFYGQVGLLGQKLKPQLDGPQESLDAEIVNEFAAIRSNLAEYCTMHPETTDAGVNADDQLRDAYGIISAGRNNYLREYAAKHGQSLDARLGIERKPLQEFRSSTKIRFVPMPEHIATWDALVPCGRSLDAVFTDLELWLMPRPDEQRSILKLESKSHDVIQKVHWDGRWIWVTTRLSGLRVFEPSGRLLGHLPLLRPAEADAGFSTGGTPSLPPALTDSSRPSSHRRSIMSGPSHDHPVFRICPVGDGRCIAVGQVGVRQRSWICSLKLDESGKWSVKLVHQGLKIVTADLTPMMKGLDYAFQPKFAVPFVLPGPERRRVVVIGRWWAGLRAHQITPLMYDLETDQVSLLDVPFQMCRFGYGYTPSVNDQLVYRPSNIQETLAQSSNEGALSATDWLWEAPLKQLIPSSRHWSRLHGNPLKFEKLLFAESTNEKRYALFATSSHFGPIAWRPNGSVARVVIDQ